MMEVNMKHLIRSTAAVLLGCIFLLTASSAWGVKPIDYERGPFQFGPFPWMDCAQFDDMDFWLWIEGNEAEYGKIFINKDGSWKQTVGTTFTRDIALWIPEDPGCNAVPFSSCLDPFTPMEGKLVTLDDFNGIAEHKNHIYRDWFIVDPDGIPETGDEFWWPTWGRQSGIFFRMVVPGYGAIVNKAGLMTTQLNFQTGQWDVTKITPNNSDANIEEVRAICGYMNDK